MKGQKKKVIEFYSTFAKKFDEFNERGYGKFADELLWRLIIPYLPMKTTQIKILDAGGGTGKYAIKIAKFYIKHQIKHFKIYLLDITPSMLEIATHKIKLHHLEKWIKLIEGDLEKTPFLSSYFDLVISLNDPIGYSTDPTKAIKELLRVVKNDGRLIISIDNKFDVLRFLISSRQFKKIKKLDKTNRIQWTKDMPLLYTFTPNTLKKIVKRAGGKIEKILGYPVFTYPTPQDVEGILYTTIFNDPKIFSLLMKIELKYIDENVAVRGNHLLAIIKKS